jgi:hypothetical protein
MLGRLERGTSRVLHFVLVTSFDHEHRSSTQRNTLPIHDGDARPGYYMEPLVATTMTVSRPTFGPAGGDHHFRRLRLRRVEGNAKALPESKSFRLHACGI